jgi:pimeloyl-ACP methyl ester carboxylesterase
MGFLRTTVGWTLTVGLCGAALILGLTAVRVQRSTTPTRTAAVEIDFVSMRLPVREVRFPAVDGLELAGWFLPGREGYPPVILCHEWGSSKESLLNLAIKLNESGFPLVLFDFRGHGASAGHGSTLGVDEKRDVLGALDYARRIDGADTSRFGIYGAGMGAHAAVLAAQDRPAVRVLVLDGLYPDASFALMRRFYNGWGPALPRPEFLPVGIFSVMNGSRPDGERASAALAGLTGRDLLFLAPAGDAILAHEIESMFARVPDQREVDGNLIVVPSTLNEGLYGEELETHRHEVNEFFSSRLLPSAGIEDG